MYQREKKNENMNYAMGRNVILMLCYAVHYKIIKMFVPLYNMFLFILKSYVCMVEYV